MVSDSAILVDTDSDIKIKGQEFRGTKGLWELLTPKNVNRKHITKEDLKKYKKLLVLTNAHLTDYQPGVDIQATRGPKFHGVISHFFPQNRRRGIEPHYDVGGKSINSRLLADYRMIPTSLRLSRHLKSFG